LKIENPEDKSMKMNVVIDGKTYEVDIEDVNSRPVIAIVEGERYEVWPEEEQQAGQVESAPMPLISVPEPSAAPPVAAQGVQGTGGNVISSPLPGVIVAVLVKPGDKVTRGQELCTLEAMKMKNAIRSSREAVIAAVEINVGDQVNHGQVLMTFEE
jgi:biotin carboxyl carrier protein